MTDTKQGKDPMCAMYECPHKEKLVSVEEQNKDLRDKNNELNQRLREMQELLGQKVQNENHPKVVEILNENLELRDTIKVKDKNLDEFNTELQLLKEQKRILETEKRVREERDLQTIKDLQNIDKRAEEQLKLIRDNDAKIHQQELRLKALEDFISQSTETVRAHRNALESFRNEVNELEQKKALYGKALIQSKKMLSKKAKRVVYLCDEIKRMKSGDLSLMDRLFAKDLGTRSEKMFLKLKGVYYSLPPQEQAMCSVEYQEIEKVMSNNISRRNEGDSMNNTTNSEEFNIDKVTKLLEGGEK
jgi:DNA repair exonuclease SbcCD ATPase subunit